MVKLYCPKCMDVYTPKSSRHHHTDGAYFGTGFPHMLFMVHPEYRPKKPTNQFVPRLYGFKIHPLAYQIQQQGASNFKVPMRTVSYNNGRKWGWTVLLCHLFHSMLPFSIATSIPFDSTHNPPESCTTIWWIKKVNFFFWKRVERIHLSDCHFNYSNTIFAPNQRNCKGWQTILKISLPRWPSADLMLVEIVVEVVVFLVLFGFFAAITNFRMNYFGSCDWRRILIIGNFLFKHKDNIYSCWKVNLSVSSRNSYCVTKMNTAPRTSTVFEKKTIYNF